MLFFNRSTFDTLGLVYPPPYGNWTSDYTTTWTWKRFAEYATIIKASGARNGFQWFGSWDEEIKLVTMIARDYGAQLLSETGTCGLGGDNFHQAMEEVIKPIFGPGGSIASTWIDSGSTDFTDWQSQPLLDPLNQSSLCCKWSQPLGIWGMSINVPKPSSEYSRYHPTLAPTGEIGRAYVPGKASFLGGSGLAITRASKKSSFAWKFLEGSSSQNYSSYVNLQLGVLSPYFDVVHDTPEWQNGWYDVEIGQFERAVPIQYPQGSFPQFGDMESKKPVRLMLAEMAFKPTDSWTLMRRMCTAIDYIMLPKCSLTDIAVELNACDPASSTQSHTYTWKGNSTCRGGVGLPSPLIVQCPYIMQDSTMAITISVIAGVCILVLLVMLTATVVLRKTSPFRLSSPLFMILSLFGCLLSSVSVLLIPGNPESRACGIEYWTLTYGFVLIVGSLIMKV